METKTDHRCQVCGWLVKESWGAKARSRMDHEMAGLEANKHKRDVVLTSQSGIVFRTPAIGKSVIVDDGHRRAKPKRVQATTAGGD